MNQFGNLYSQYYDLLYQDKDYIGEVKYIDNLIKQFSNNAKSMLDMGCGTGKHAALLCDKGYTIHGIDLSEDMLEIANGRRKGKEDKLEFTHSDIQTLNLNKKFDVVVSLFHVMSYQNSNAELIKAFKVAKEHLNERGVFIFDFWYAPAVLTDLPVTRVKKLENDLIKVTRVAEPKSHPQKNIIDVHYDVFIEEKKTAMIIQKQEVHKMRYLFDTELEMICNKLDMTIEYKSKWLSDEKPGFNSWNVVWVIKK